MPSITTINGIPIANISNVSAHSNIVNILDVDYIADTVYLRTDFNNINEGAGIVPQHWQTNTTSTIYYQTFGMQHWYSTTDTWDTSAITFGSQTGDVAITPGNVFSSERGRSPSLGTGPRAGHNSVDTTTGEFSDLSKPYMYIESSNTPGSRYILRTPGIDISTAPANNTLKLSFWFHMFGVKIGSLGVSITTSSLDASYKSEASESLGFISDTLGGASMYHWVQPKGTAVSSSIRIVGEQQKQGDRRTTDASLWRKAEIDLNSLAGSSEDIYVWFYGKTLTGTKSYRGDIAIDDIIIVGE